MDGVVKTEVGYTGGHVPGATYKQVCSGTTGHAEAVRVTYAAQKVDYASLIQIFWDNHDPTQGDAQGPNVGNQYRSALFFHTSEQEAIAIASRNALAQSGRFSRPITTQILAADDFVVAEDYHQQYYEKLGMVAPKVR